MLRDRLVLGANHKKLQHRLLSEPELTFAKSLHIARTMETAEKDTQQLKGQHETVLYTQKSNTRKKLFLHSTSSGWEAQPQMQVCYMCGGNHLPFSYSFIEVEYRNCHKKGHIPCMCHSKSAAHQKVLGNQKLQHRDSRTQIIQPKYRARAFTQKKKPPAESLRKKVLMEIPPSRCSVRGSITPTFIVTVELQGQEIWMESDIGTTQSIVSEETY